MWRGRFVILERVGLVGDSERRSIIGTGMIFGTHDDNTLAQLADVASRAEQTSLMADGHLGYIMPIGWGCSLPEQGFRGGRRFRHRVR